MIKFMGVHTQCDGKKLTWSLCWTKPWTKINPLHINLIWGRGGGGFFRVFWEMAFFVCLGIFHWQKSNFGKITSCSYSINIDVIVCFFIHNYLKDIYSMSHFYFCLPWLLESCIPVIFLYKKCMYPPFFFLLKYYCAVIQYHINCNKSYLCNLQQKNDVSVNLLIGPTIYN
jgi:hypothetical protein